MAVYGMHVLCNCNIPFKLKYLGHKERQDQEPGGGGLEREINKRSYIVEEQTWEILEGLYQQYEMERGQLLGLESDQPHQEEEERCLECGAAHRLLSGSGMQFPSIICTGWALWGHNFWSTLAPCK